MSIKDEILFLKNQSFANDNFDNSKNGSQYSNFNLNQSKKCSNLSPIFHFKSISFKNKNCDSALCDSNEQREKSRAFKKPSKSFGLITSNHKANEEVKKDWKKDSINNAINKSILSLHIEVYENSTVTTIDSSRNENEKSNLIKKGETKKQFFNGSSSNFHNTFEFPRQQKNEISEPELSQYKASQRLINPSASGNNVRQEGCEKPDMSDDDSRGYMELGPSCSQSQISTTDTIYDGPFGSSPVNLKILAKEFGLNASKTSETKLSTSSKSDFRDQISSLSSNISNSSLESILSNSDINFEGYSVISKLNPNLLPRRSASFSSLSSITSVSPKPQIPTIHRNTSSSSFSSITSQLPPNTRASNIVRSSSSSSSIISDLPPKKQTTKALLNNLTIITDSKYTDNYSDGSVTSELPTDHYKIYQSPSNEPRWSSTTIGSRSDNAFSFGDAKDVYRSLIPEFNFKSNKTDSLTSMDLTQTESDIFPLGEGYSPGGTCQQSFDGGFRSSTTSLSSTKSIAGSLNPSNLLTSDEYNTFSSSASNDSLTSDEDLSSSDASCCLTPPSEDDLELDDDEEKSNILCASEIFENALHSMPPKLEIESDNCVVFYLENHSSNELLIALDAPSGIDCSPTDMSIEGYKKKKIVVIARKSMLPGTRNKIRVTYKLNNDKSYLKIPFSIV